LSRPKQQHYVTKAYLDGFLAPSVQHLFCYGRNGSSFRRSTDDLAKQRNFYALKTEEGEWDDSLEHLIEKTVEVPGLPVIKKLSAGKTRLNWDDRRALSLLIAIQEARTPAARQNVIAGSKLMTDRILQDIKAANPEQKTIDLIGKSDSKSTVTLEEIVESHDDLTKDHSAEVLRLAMGPALELYHYYMQMRFTVHYPLGTARFITTDTPVIRVFHQTREFGTGINRPDVEIRFPLSANALLTITHDLRLAEQLIKANENKRSKLLANLPEVRVRYVRDGDVLAFNRGHARHARMWAFSSQELDWMAEVLAARSAAPQMIDLSSRDLLHFQSRASYDPKIDMDGR
jgi:hypothetical protein